MSMRHVLLLTAAVFTFGCSSQPTAPSILPSTSALSPSAQATQSVLTPARFDGRGTPGVVYVTSQGLYYDTFVVQDPLPMEGNFQLIENGTTEFGPGERGYLGGRW